MKFLFLCAVLSIFTVNAYAQDFDINDNYYENDEMNIEGDFKNKRLTAAERARIYRKKLERKNEELVRKQIERIRLQKELMLMKQLNQSFNDALKRIDTIGQ